jgi:hypothetical protein
VVSERPGDAASDLIRRLRAHLLGHFLGVGAADFEHAYGELGSVSAAIEARNRRRRLEPLGVEAPSVLSGLIARWQLGDPTSPEDSWRPWRRERLWRALRALAQAGAAG